MHWNEYRHYDAYGNTHGNTHGDAHIDADLGWGAAGRHAISCLYDDSGDNWHALRRG